MPLKPPEYLQLSVNALEAGRIQFSRRGQSQAHRDEAEAARQWIKTAEEMGAMLLSIFSHVSHGGPTRAEGEALLRKAGLL